MFEICLFTNKYLKSLKNNACLNLLSYRKKFSRFNFSKINKFTFWHFIHYKNPGIENKIPLKIYLIYSTNSWKINTIIFTYMKRKFTCQTCNRFDVWNLRQFIMMLEEKTVYLSRENKIKKICLKKKGKSSFFPVSKKSKMRYIYWHICSTGICASG